jgi:thymidylate synthase
MATKQMNKKADVQNVETATVEAKVIPEWAQRARIKSIENREKMMETGLFFQGKPGEKVRGIFLEHEMREDLTKGGSEVFAIKVIRLSSHKEQTLTVLQGITSVVDQLLAIAEKHDWNMKDVIFDATFIAGRTGANYIKTVEEVPVPKMEVA